MAEVFLNFKLLKYSDDEEEAFITNSVAGRSLRKLYVAVGCDLSKVVPLLCALLRQQRDLDTLAIFYYDRVQQCCDEIQPLLCTLGEYNQRRATVYTNASVFDTSFRNPCFRGISRIKLIGWATRNWLMKQMRIAWKCSNSSLEDIEYLPHTAHSKWFSRYCANPAEALCPEDIPDPTIRPMDAADIVAAFTAAPLEQWCELSATEWYPKIAIGLRANRLAHWMRRMAVALVFLAFRRPHVGLGRDMARALIRRLDVNGWMERGHALAEPTQEQRTMYHEIRSLAAQYAEERSIHKAFENTMMEEKRIEQLLREFKERLEQTKRMRAEKRAQLERAKSTSQQTATKLLKILKPD